MNHKKRQSIEDVKISDNKTIEDDYKTRKLMLYASSKQNRQGCWRSIFLNALVALSFYSYFMFTYIFHMKEVSNYF